MTTEAQTAGTTAVATEAPTAAPAAAAPAEPAKSSAAPAAGGAIDFRDIVAQQLGRGPRHGQTTKPERVDRADAPMVTDKERAASGAKTEPKTSPASGEAATEATAAATTEVAKPAAEQAKPEPPKDAVDDLDARLRALTEASNKAAAARKARERESKLVQREKDVDARHAAELERLQRLDAAVKTKSPVATLRAAGYTDDEIRGSVGLQLLEELGKDDAAPAPLTQADVAKLLEAKEAEQKKASEEAEAKAKAEREAAQAEAKEVYFAQIAVEFKAGEYPALKAEGITKGQLDQFYWSYRKQNPAHDPTAKELLDLAEARVIKSYDEQEKKIQSFRARGKPAAAAPAAAQATATAKPAEAKPVPPSAKPERPARGSSREPYAKPTEVEESRQTRRDRVRESEQRMRDEIAARYQ